MSARSRYVYPTARCSRCGRERPCRYARSEAPVCESCLPRGPEWTLVAPCSICGQTKRCRRNRESGEPVCQSCSRKREVCACCGKVAPVEARTPRGPFCQRCLRARLHSKISCPSCGQKGRPSLRDPTICERCAGEEVRRQCGGCGAEETNYLAGRCARCVLRERLDELVRGGERVAVEALGPYLEALAENPKPETVLRWMGKSRSYRTLVELATGALPLDHEALDGVERGQSTDFLRAALVRHGALPERVGRSAALGAFIARQAKRVPTGPERLALRRFATWKVQAELALAERQGRAKRTSAAYARTKIRVAADLLVWLAECGLGLADLRQGHLDHWLAAQAGDGHRIRIFLTWATREGIVPPLTVPAGATRRHVDPLDPRRRSALLRRLLGDEDLELGDRVAGSLLLLFAQPVSRLARLRKEEVQEREGRLFIGFGKEPLALPEPLATLTRRLRDRRSGPPSTGVRLDSEWLFPGLRLDAPVHEEALCRRLRRLGIPARAARGAAAIELAKTLPATILADLLGFDAGTAEDWVRLAGGEWAHYAAAAGDRLGSGASSENLSFAAGGATRTVLATTASEK